MNFYEVKCVAPSYTLKIMKSQKKLGRVCAYTPVYTQIRDGGGQIWPPPSRVAEVARACEQRSPKGQGLLRKEGPPTYAILSRNLELSRFTLLLKGHHRAFYKSHPALGVFSTKVSLLLKGFQQKSACFRRGLGELS